MTEKNFKLDPDKAREKRDELQKKEAGVYLFPQVGKTKVRLLLAPEREPEDFYQPVLRLFKDRSKTQYMIPCITEGETGSWGQEVQYLVVGKMTLDGIMSLIIDGDYDLLSPDGAYGILIVRSGEGLNTTYQVMASKNQIPIVYDAYEFEKPLLEMAHDLEKADRERVAEEDKDDYVPF